MENKQLTAAFSTQVSLRGCPELGGAVMQNNLQQALQETDVILWYTVI